MILRTIFTLVLPLTLILASCGGNSDNATNNEAANPSNTPASSVSNTATDVEHPCDALSAETIAKAFSIDASKIAMEKEDFAGAMSCMISSTEFDKYEESAIIISIQAVTNKDGKYQFANMITKMVEAGETQVKAGPDKGKTVPATKIDGVGDNAVVYSSSSEVMLIFETGNQIRYSIAVSRNAPSPVFNGFDTPVDELTQQAVALAKNLLK